MTRAHRALRDIRIPTDVLVKTQAEFERYRTVRTSLMAQIFYGGKSFMNEREEVVSSWLLKAERDLKTAAWLTRSPDSLLDTAIYHLQQAGEKAVNGFLTFHDISFSKTHDIAVLVTAATRVVPEFSAYLGAAELLTPYGVVFCYPDEIAEPTPEEFGEALTAARNLHTFVLAKLPADVQP